MSKLTMAQLNDRVELLTARIEVLETKVSERRGPKSSRQMTDDDAERIMMGDLKDSAHKVCAEELGLSYGQVYSARNGFTFKGVYKKMQSDPATEVGAKVEA